jgi:DNA-binding response OmpR family regulator
MRILIVEDNADTGASLGLVLKALGHEARHVLDGETALDVTPTFNPHVVVMDLGLPGLNGHETAKRMRALDQDEDMLIFALTGQHLEGDREKSKASGINYHLLKPLHLVVLMELLQLHPASKAMQ